MIALTFDVESLTNDKDKSEKYIVPKILKLLDKYNIKATFFVTGKIAEKFPNLVTNISKKRHEIGSHSYNHLRLANLSLQQQKEEIRKSKEVLENLILTKIIGFRAPFLSFTTETFWILKKEGFIYDSSAHKHFDTQKLPVTELFCCLPDDFNIFESTRAIETEKEKIEKWIETSKKIANSLKWHEINIQVYHPWVIAKNLRRLNALDSIINYIVKKNIEIRTCQEIIEKSNFFI
jgi:peptidoglycan/xylan/chitin deacetylase (PgdA/CDA1 family)